MDGWCPFAERITGVTTFDAYHIGNVGFCDHAAGGFYSTMQRASFWNGQGVSTHFAVARDGRICQMVSIFNTAFAQGRLGPVVSWKPYEAMGKQNPNLYLISTEHEDAETVNGQTRFIPGSQWTEAQYQADLKLKRWCIEEVKRVTGGNVMTFGLDSLAGHHMFDAVNRAECPGRFWRNEYRARLYADLNGGNEIMIRHNAVAPSMDDTQLDNSTAGIPLTAFQPALPDNLALLRVEVYATQGNRAAEPEIRVLDGDGQSYAGQLGWGRGEQDIYGMVDVKVQNGRFHLQGTGTVKRIGCVGFWT